MSDATPLRVLRQTDKVRVAWQITGTPSGTARRVGILLFSRDKRFTAAAIIHRKLFRRACRSGTSWGDGMTEKVVWHVVKMHAKKMELPKLAPHDLRRSYARFCHAAVGELEQIQCLLGPVSSQTAERCLGCKQRLREAVNDRFGIEPTMWNRGPKSRLSMNG